MSMMGYPFVSPEGIELALCNAAARLVLQQGMGFPAAAADALEFEASNGELPDAFEACLRDEALMQQYVAALATAMARPEVLDDVLGYMTFIDSDHVLVPRQEVEQRLLRIVAGLEAPWPMTWFWQRKR